MEKRITWIDGLKGLACLGVFWSHFFLIFYPAIYFGSNAISHTNSRIDEFLSQSILSVGINGNFMVAIFCILSGMVVSLQVMKIEDKAKMSKIILKRYVRLALPLLAITLIIWLMINMHVFNDSEIFDITGSSWLQTYYYNGVYTLKEAFKTSLSTVWVTSNNRFSTAFWMLNQVFWGSFISIILSQVYWGIKDKKLIGIYLIAFSILFWKDDFLIAFVLGTLLAYLYISNTSIKRILAVLSVLAGCFLGGYPSGIEPVNYYSLISFSESSYLMAQRWHIIGAFLLVFGLMNCNVLKKVLSLRLFERLGKISFSIFLIHIPMIFSISVYCFKIFFNKGYSYFHSCMITFIVSNIAVICMSTLFYMFIEKPCVKISNKVFDRIYIS